MRYKLKNPEPFIIELLDCDVDPPNIVYRKDIRDLKYPAPQVFFDGPLEIKEICPDTGRYVEHHLP